jgi:acyl carrier protein
MTTDQFVKMTEYNSQERIIDLISWIVNVPSAHIHPYTLLKDDLELDPIDMLLLIAELESQFNIYLTPEEVETIETVQDISFFFQKQAA